MLFLTSLQIFVEKLRQFPATGPEAFLDPVEEVLSQLPHPCKLRLAVFDHVAWIPFEIRRLGKS